MTDRGLPIVDGAPACPFVAFDDDREGRAGSPDARHRCFAEVRPAPRALAHQDAYCLSSAFALCPTFQDWARREGARVQAAPRPPAAPQDQGAGGRNPARGWAAPPPWLGSVEDEHGTRRGGGSATEPPDFAGGRRRESGLAGSLAHRVAMDGAPAAPAADGRDGTGLPRFVPPEASGRAPAGWRSRADDNDDDEVDDDVPARLRDHDDGRAHGGSGGSGGSGDTGGGVLGRVAGLIPRGRPKVGDTRGRRRPGDSGPAWERPQRFEAYPMLRTRMGVPAVPRVVLLFLVVVLAAVGLFFLPGMLGLGGPKATPTPLPVPSRSPGATFSFAPTTTPPPAALTYQVAPGDTMSKIAAKFGVPLTDLIAVNKDKYPNPDKIVAGDTLIIPAAIPSGFKDATSPAPSKAPSKAP